MPKRVASATNSPESVPPRKTARLVAPATRPEHSTAHTTARTGASMHAVHLQSGANQSHRWRPGRVALEDPPEDVTNGGATGLGAVAATSPHVLELMREERPVPDAAEMHSDDGECECTPPGAGAHPSAAYTHGRGRGVVGEAAAEDGAVSDAAQELESAGTNSKLCCRSANFLELKKIDIKPESKSNGQVVGRESDGRGRKLEFISFHRVDLRNVLCKTLPSSVRVHFSKRLSPYVQLDTGKIEIHFKDDTTANCDVLVGCDSIRSAVRPVMLSALAADLDKAGRHIEATAALSGTNPIWTGTLYYRCLIPREPFALAFLGHWALSENILYMGKGKHIMVYTFGNGSNVKLSIGAGIGHPYLRGSDYDGPWVAPGEKAELEKEFDYFEPEVRALALHMDKPSRWALHMVPPLPAYVHNKVALLGDAAHAMEHYQSVGAGQAIGDAYILASVLAHPEINAENVTTALQVYDEIRRPFAQEVARKSHESGLLLHFNAADFSGFSAEYSASGAVDTNVIDAVGRRHEELIACLTIPRCKETRKELGNSYRGDLGIPYRSHELAVANEARYPTRWQRLKIPRSHFDPPLLQRRVMFSRG
ncbi:hypothetical protein CERSUDRAFT_74585 [Gelatoporia subvermispora B]|uniref:FAD-binding domain-containing protein n=1 Tax=Ceriporiopsis subvermispora (strain B) TaxID=914234 RepID=M2PI12_CERS8|nr:hypothetical protein CERSUDRAFT_74585 [Gelatoporia subvermispora B]